MLHFDWDQTTVSVFRSFECLSLQNSTIVKFTPLYYPSYFYQLRCCGGVKFEDYKDSEWVKSMQKQGISDVAVISGDIVPGTCCKNYQGNDTAKDYCIAYTNPTLQPGIVGPNLYRKVRFVVMYFYIF